MMVMSGHEFLQLREQAIAREGQIARNISKQFYGDDAVAYNAVPPPSNVTMTEKGTEKRGEKSKAVKKEGAEFGGAKRKDGKGL